MEIKGEDLNTALVQAVLTAFKPEQQTAVFREALRQYLFEPQKTQYGSNPSPFSQAFQKALDDAARKVALEFLAEPEQVDRMRTAMRTAFDKMIESPEVAAALVTKLSQNFGLGRF